MRALEFNTKLCSLLGVELSGLRTIDRSLSDEGLRRKSVGRKTFEVSRTEAIRILVGVAVAENRTRAAGPVGEREKFILSGSHDPALAEFLGVAKNAKLFTAIGRACEILANDEKPHGIWLMVEQYGGIEIRIQRDGLVGELRFTGALKTSDAHHGMKTVSTFSPTVLGWIGKVANG